jgi:hypothetical protein
MVVNDDYGKRWFIFSNVGSVAAVVGRILSVTSLAKQISNLPKDQMSIGVFVDIEAWVFR